MITTLQNLKLMPNVNDVLDCNSVQDYSFTFLTISFFFNSSMVRGVNDVNYCEAGDTYVYLDGKRRPGVKRDFSKSRDINVAEM